MPENEENPNAYIFPETHTTSHGIQVRIGRFIQTIPPRYELFVVIDETTTKAKLNKDFAEIREILDRLNRRQGSDLNLKYRGILVELMDLHERGFGYGQIAKILNYRSLAAISCAYFSEETIENPGLGIFLLETIFIAMGVYSKFKEKVTKGMHLLKEDRLPWNIIDGPFSTSKVRETLRTFEKQMNRGVISLPDQLQQYEISIDDATLYLGHWYEKANELM